jgi:hypothetical protein
MPDAKNPGSVLGHTSRIVIQTAWQ